MIAILIQVIFWIKQIWNQTTTNSNLKFGPDTENIEVGSDLLSGGHTMVGTVELKKLCLPVKSKVDPCLSGIPLYSILEVEKVWNFLTLRKVL